MLLSLCLLMMLIKLLHTVIVMAQIVSILFPSPTCFSVSFVQIKNHTNSIFSGFLYFVLDVFNKLKNWSNIDTEIPDDVVNIKRN